MKQTLKRRVRRHKSRGWLLKDRRTEQEYTVVVESRFKSPQARKGNTYFVVRVK